MLWAKELYIMMLFATKLGTKEPQNLWNYVVPRHGKTMRKSLKPWSKLIVVVQFVSVVSLPFTLVDLFIREINRITSPGRTFLSNFNQFFLRWILLGPILVESLWCIISDNLMVYLMISMGLMGFSMGWMMITGWDPWSIQVTPICIELDEQDALEPRLCGRSKTCCVAVSLGSLGPKSWGGWVAVSLLVWLLGCLFGLASANLIHFSEMLLVSIVFTVLPGWDFSFLENPLGLTSFQSITSDYWFQLTLHILVKRGQHPRLVCFPSSQLAVFQTKNQKPINFIGFNRWMQHQFTNIQLKNHQGEPGSWWMVSTCRLFRKGLAITFVATEEDQEVPALLKSSGKVIGFKSSQRII